MFIYKYNLSFYKYEWSLMSTSNVPLSTIFGMSYIA
jgi:hypothetical protein